MLIVVASFVLAISALLFLVCASFRSNTGVAATGDAGKAASRHRRQQHDARPAAVRFDPAARDLQPALYRDVRLSAEVIKPGCSFHDVISHRKQTGSFNGDVDHYVRLVLRDIATAT